MNADIKKILSELTLEEKASLCSGRDYWHNKPIERLDVPAVMMADGPHGLRKEDNKSSSIALKASFPATCFPTAVTVASTWNRELLAKMGRAIAKEAKEQQLSTVLGPGINIKRSPLCGRNFEYFSEDPLVAGELAAAYINGVQESGVGTSLKHYAVNNQEYLRMSVSAVADERTLREIYLAGFEKAVKLSQPQTVMCSYNRINGLYSSDNKWLLTDVLRKEWGFKGIVVSDWGATNDRVEGIKAGMDLQMPGPDKNNDKKIVNAVKSGNLETEYLDGCAERMLNYICEAHKAVEKDYKYDYAEGHAVSREIASEGAVLLKNEGGILPIKSSGLTVIGALAKTPRYQGSGSSRINPKNLVSFMDHCTAIGVKAEYAEGYALKGDGWNEELAKQALELAKGKENVVIFAGLTDEYEAEGADRSTLDMPAGHNKLIEAVAAVNPNVIVVLQCGSPVLMPWLNMVKAVLNTYLTGEANGEVTYSLLTGAVNPSGKLAETFPLSLDSNIVSKYFRSGPRTVEHRESVFVGYRYFDAAAKPVLFPFGFGLSYTTFKYDNFKLSAAKIKEGAPLSVSFIVTNTGSAAGAETAQVYVSDIESTVFRPVKELKGFAKVHLAPGETKEITIALDSRAFAYYNTLINNWHIESGEFKIMVGSSSADILWTETVAVTSAEPKVKAPELKDKCPEYYNLSKAEGISDKTFENLINQPLPDNSPYVKGEFDKNCTINDIKETGIGKIFMTFGIKAIRSQAKNADFTTMLVLESAFKEVPLRSFSSLSQGIVGDKMVNALVNLANGKFFKGFFGILGSIPATIATLISIRKQEKKIRKNS